MRLVDLANPELLSLRLRLRFCCCPSSLTCFDVFNAGMLFPRFLIWMPIRFLDVDGWRLGPRDLCSCSFELSSLFSLTSCFLLLESDLSLLPSPVFISVIFDLLLVLGVAERPLLTLGIVWNLLIFADVLLLLFLLNSIPLRDLFWAGLLSAEPCPSLLLRLPCELRRSNPPPVCSRDKERVVVDVRCAPPP